MKNRINYAFTLLELLSVLAVVSILLALIVGVAKYAENSADRARARTEIEKIQNALQDYMLENGRYPNTNEFVSAVFTNSLPNGFQFGAGGALDPWNHPYQYKTNSLLSYTLFSYGIDGTNTRADDIYSGK